MSDERREPADPESAAVERALAVLERGGGMAEPPADAAEATLARLHVETLGLLPYALEPVAPNPELKERILHAILGDETIAVPGQAQAIVRPPASSGERPRPPIPPVPFPMPPVAARSRRWPLALAASLAALFVATSGWLAYRVSDLGSQVGRLRTELRQAQVAQAEAASARAALTSARDNLALVSSKAVIVCPLRPMGKDDAPPPQPNAFGVLFVAADHQHWYLSVRGLGKCPEGRVYQVWFHGQGDTLASGGTFDVTPGAPSEISSPTMPADTRAVSVTLEPRGGVASPTGPLVLHGEELTQIL